MAMSSKRRAELRAEAHHLKPSVHVGQQGMTSALLHSLDDALRTHELVKIQVSRRSPTAVRDMVPELARRLHADIVQVIGGTASLYRENPTLERKPDAPPPWRR